MSALFYFEPTDTQGYLLRRALRYWRSALLLFALGTIALAVLVARTSSVYRSQAVVLYQDRAAALAPKEPGHNARRVSLRLREVVLSRGRLAQVAKSLGLYQGVQKTKGLDAAAERLQADVGLRMKEGDTISLWFDGPSPQVAQAGAKWLVEALFEEVRKTTLALDGMEGASTFLQEETERLSFKLRQSEERLSRFLSAHPEYLQATEGTGGVHLPGRELSPQQREVQALFSQRVASAVAELDSAQREVFEKRRTLMEEHPDLRRALGRLEVARKVAEQLQGQNPRLVGEGQGPGKEGARQDLDTTWIQLVREASDIHNQRRELEDRRFHAALRTRLFQEGAAKLEVLDPPSLPSRQVGYRKVVVGLFGFCFLLGVTALYLALRGRLDRRIYDRHDVAQLAMLPVLVSVARVHPKDHEVLA